MINRIDQAGNRGWLFVLAGATSLALLALAGPVIASDGDPKAAQNETVIVKVIKHRQDGKPADDKAFSEGATVRMLEKCGAGKKVETDTETKSDNGEIRRTRVVLCSKGTHDSKAMIEHLEATRKRMAAETQLTAEERTKVLAALDAEIARAKGAANTTPFSRQ
jgi:hypothetical protein